MTLSITILGHNAECRYLFTNLLIVLMQSVIMLSVVMLSVIMLSDRAPKLQL
jgi:hypothetical protein